MADVKNEYWAAKPVHEIAAAIEEQFETYKKWMVQSGYSDRIIAAYRDFYGFSDAGTLRVTRDEHDTARIKVNHYKSLLRRLHILVTESKLAFQPRSRNSDSKSQIESDLAKGICEYYADEKHMHATLSDAVKGALIMLEQWVHCPWSLAEGYELTADGQQVVKSGDQTFELYSPLDVAKATAGTESPWRIIRVKVNKFDEAALHPEFAEEIIGSSIEPDSQDLQLLMRPRSGVDEDADYTYKYIFYHERSPAMPYGRHVEVIAQQVLTDGELRYAKVPCFRITAGDVLGTAFGDSPAIDLLPLQQALDALLSGTVTNNINNAQQLIWSQDPNLATRYLSDGQTLVTSSSEPKGLNLTASASENYKMIDLLVSHQQLLSGVNDVARGNAPSSVTTNGGLALMLAQAIQYVNDLQKNYAQLAGDVGSCLVNNIQTFATEEMTAYITGVARKGQIKTFKASDLMNVERVTVDLGNPLTQTLTGRKEITDAWLQYGAMTDPKQIVGFLRTGEIDGATEDKFSDEIYIREENEMLRKGETPAVLITDNHGEHIVGHKGIMSSKEAREDPAVLAAWMAHVQEHMAAMRDMPPDLAAVLSGQPIPPPMPAGGPQQAPGAPVEQTPMPNVPNGTPPQVEENYAQAQAAMPASLPSAG